jgi:hypothetical protein
MPRRAKPTKPKPEPTRKVRRPRKSKIAFELPSPETALDVIRSVHSEMLDKIRAGYGSFGAKEDLERVRARAQALQEAYPVLWEQVCREAS